MSDLPWNHPDDDGPLPWDAVDGGPVQGKISDKTKAVLGPKDPAWTPERPGMKAPIRGTKLPEGVDGTTLSQGSGMSARDEHRAAVYAAKEKTMSLLDQAARLMGQLEEGRGLVANATGGEDADMESGQNAFLFTGGALELCRQLWDQLKATLAELERYGAGF